MKKIFLGISLIALSVFARAQQGLENIIVEKYYISDANDAAGATGYGDALPAGSTTYRVYVDMLPGYKFQAAFGTQDVSGTPLHTLKLMTSTSFYNNTDRGHEIPSFSKANAAQHTTMLDSYFSAGAACATGTGPTYNYGILKADDGAAGGTNVVNANGILQNNDPNAGIPLTTADGIYGVSTPAVSSVTFVGMPQAQIDFDAGPSSGSFISSNASWAALNGATGPTADNRVLIGQFTTNGCFYFELNIQIGTPSGGVQKYVARNPTGNEILFPACLYNTATVSIAPTPAAPVCAGTSVTFAASITGGGASPVYQWIKNGSNVGTNSSTYTTTVAANDQISCVLTSNLACVTGSPATSNMITIYAPASAAAVSGCEGTSIALAGSPAGGTYSVANPYTGSGTTYTYSLTDANGCATTSAPATITVNPLPTVTANDVSGCVGSPVTLTGTPAGGSWTLSNPYSGTASSYQHIYTDGNGCTNASPVATITRFALPATSISGNAFFCTGSNTVLNSNATAGSGNISGYQWKESGNSITGETNATYSATGAGSYTVVVTNDNGCSKTSVAFVVTVNPLPTVTASDVSGCAGSAIALSGAPAGGTFSVADPYTGPGTTYTHSFTDGNGCSNTSAAANITVNPLPSVSFTGLAATYNLSDAAATLTGSPAGGTFSGPGISGNTFDPSAAGAGGPYTITYSYTDGNGCSNSSSQQTSVIQCTLDAGVISGKFAGVCAGTTRTYGVVNVAGNTYNWTAPANTSITGGQGTHAVTLVFLPGFTSGMLSVIASNVACGSGPASSHIIKSVPNMPGTMTGTAMGLCGLTNVAYSVPNVSGNAYFWSITPPGAVITSGQFTNSITVDFTSSGLVDTIKVITTNSCGASPERTKIVRMVPKPGPAITGDNMVTSCVNETYSINPIDGASSYLWTVPNGSSVVSGQGTTNVIVDFGNNSGNITVKGVNSCGSGQKSIMTVSVSGCARLDGNNASLAENVTVYPNPTSGKITSEYKSAIAENYSLQILDLAGRLLISENGSFTEGTNLVESDLSALAKGVYVLKINSATVNSEQRIAVQ